MAGLPGLTIALPEGMLHMESLAGSEYRRNPRVPARRPLLLEIRPAGGKSASHPVTARDVSLGGLCVVIAQCDLTVGSGLSVSLPIGGVTLTLGAQVAWIRPCPDGFRMGLKLHPKSCDPRSRRAFDSFVRSSERAYLTDSELSKPF